MTHVTQPPRRRRGLAVLIALGAGVLYLGGCGGSSPAEEPPFVPSGDVTKALRTLGADLAPPPRLDQAGRPTEAKRPPLGLTPAFSAHHELYFAGVRPVGSTSSAYRGLIPHGALDGDGLLAAAATNLLPETSAGWAANPPGTGDSRPRAAIPCDVNGDGHDEIVTLWRAGDGLLYLQADGGSNLGYAPVLPATALGLPANAADPVGDVDLACGDFRGDGRRLVALAWAGTPIDFGQAAAGGIRILDPADGWRVAWSQAAGSVLMIRLAAGDLDRDGADELVTAISPWGGTGSGAIRRFAGAGAAFAETSRFEVPDLTEQAPGVVGTSTATNVSVAVGDVDGDGLPSAIFVGPSRTESLYDTTRHYVARRFRHDAAAGSYAQVAAKAWFPARANACGGSSYPDKFPDKTFVYACGGLVVGDLVIVQPTFVGMGINEAMVRVARLDGGRAGQILINDTVYDGTFTERWSLPSQDGKAGCFFRNQLWWHGACAQGVDGAFGRGHDAIAVGKFLDGAWSGRDVIATVQSTMPGIQLFGLDAAAGKIVTIGQVPLRETPGADAPLLVPVDVAGDGLRLRYRQHAVELTEPIPVAAVAAPPCWSGAFQNTDDCASSFGRSASQGGGTSDAFSFGASQRLGAMGEVPFDNLVGANLGVEVSAAVSAETQLTWGSETAVTSSVTYTAGSMEDMVVFSTVPFDVYDYEIVSVDPAAGQGRPGDVVQVKVPRTPQVLKAERSFYNAAVRDIALDRVIGPETFQHVIGDPTTYPTIAQRDALLAAAGNAAGQGSSAVCRTGAGTGATEVSLEVSRTQTFAYDTSVTASLTIKGNLGYGFSESEVTAGTGWGFSWGWTDSTTYSGTVGDVTTSSFATKQYGFGLFEYNKRDHPSGFPFPVVGYWVE